jgi:hypothetical protein
MNKRYSKCGGGTLMPYLIREYEEGLLEMKTMKQSEEMKDEIDEPSMKEIRKALRNLKIINLLGLIIFQKRC